MQNDLLQFAGKWLGETINFTNNPGKQCVDLFLQYNQDVIKCPEIFGNAIDIKNTYNRDFYTWIDNDPNDLNQFPIPGDVAIFDINQYGHIAIVLAANGTKLLTLDQNWSIGSSVMGIDHEYLRDKVIGWLRPKNYIPIIITTPNGAATTNHSQPATVVIPRQQIDYFIELFKKLLTKN